MNKYTEALLRCVPHKIDEHTTLGLPEGVSPDTLITVLKMKDLTNEIHVDDDRDRNSVQDTQGH